MELVTVDKEHLDLGIRQKVQFARVNGLSDPVLAERVNEKLKSAATTPLQNFQDELAFPDQPAELDPSLPRTRLLTSKATIGLRGPRVVSVSYAFATDGAEFGRFVGSSGVFLALDLTDGRELGARDLLSARAATDEGARELGALLARHGDGGALCPSGEPSRALTAADFVSDDALVSLWPASRGMTFRLHLWKLGYPMSCNPTDITVPYTALTPFTGPALK